MDQSFISLVSPGFTSRPSLSGAPHGGRWRRTKSRVAGIHVPAFVERRSTARSTAPRAFTLVSPGFTSRPSLSGGGPEKVPRPTPRVAHVPAFVERCNPGTWGESTHRCRRDSRPGLR